MTTVGIMQKIPVKGLTKGRGSYSAISKQITTKFKRGIIHKVSFNTFRKMFLYEFYSGALDLAVNSFLD